MRSILSTFAFTVLLLVINLSAQRLQFEYPASTTGTFVASFSGPGTYALAVTSTATPGRVQFIDESGVITSATGFEVIRGLDDVDGDGRGDFAGRPTGGASAGLVGPYSAQSLTPFWLTNDATPAGVDLTGDGIQDWTRVPAGGTPVTVIDGFSGAVYATLNLVPFSRTAGDINGDGVEDWLSPGGAAGLGQVFSGSDMSVLYAPTAPARPLRAGVGDINGDGFGDLLVGALDDPFYCEGTYQIVYGSTFVTTPTFTQCLSSPVRMGDLDNDGRDDCIAPSNAPLAGPRFWLGDQFLSPQHVFSFGSAAFPLNPVRLGDLDGDGYPEVGFGTSKGFPAPRATIWRFNDVPSWFAVRTGSVPACTLVQNRPALDGAAPIIGTDAFVRLRHTSAQSYVLFSGIEIVSPIAIGACELFLDPLSVVAVSQGLLPPSIPGYPFTINWGIIPNDPLLIGARFTLQAALIEANGSFSLTNLIAGQVGEQFFNPWFGFMR